MICSALECLKRLNDAGVINAAVALGTLGAVAVALLPTISKWWYRPRLRLEISSNYFYTWEHPQPAPG